MTMFNKDKKNAEKKKNSFAPIIGLIVLAVIVGGASGAALQSGLGISFFGGAAEDQIAEQLQSPVAEDAESYYKETAEGDVTEMDAASSEDVFSEAEAYEFLADRFQIEMFDTIHTEYDMDGTYISTKEIDSDSDEKHPLYEAYYFSGKGEIWTITLVNGSIMASPVSFNTESELDVEVMVSENEYVESYDGRTNKFFKSVPSKDELLVIPVDRIDDSTLDELTASEIGAIVS